jgi:hypothetical protein
MSRGNTVEEQKESKEGGAARFVRFKILDAMEAEDKKNARW